jgi:hypothetical protein
MGAMSFDVNTFFSAPPPNKFEGATHSMIGLVRRFDEPAGLIIPDVQHVYLIRFSVFEHEKMIGLKVKLKRRFVDAYRLYREFSLGTIR